VHETLTNSPLLGIGELLGLLERYGLDGEAEQQLAEAALQVESSTLNPKP